MALTPVGGTTAYITPQDVFFRYDIRDIADYLSDTGFRYGGSPNPDPDVVATCPSLVGPNNILMEASGWFETCLMRSKRYQLADFNALKAQAGNGWAFCVGLIAGYAMYLIWSRRPAKFAQKELPGSARWSVDQLTQLSEGKNILPFLETAEAGLPELQVESFEDVYNRYLSSIIARRFMGRRVNQYNQGWWGG